MRTWPDWGLRSPAIICSSLLAPHPGGPMIAVWVDRGNTTVPRVLSVRVTSSIATILSWTMRYGPVRYATCTSRLRSRTFTIHGAQVSIRARRTPFKLRKLLVIDDDAALVAAYRDLLLPYGFQVLTASDGQDAIPIVEQNPDILLVILDLAMPRMDGREWLRWFRGHRRESPVIIISAYKLDASDEDLRPAVVLEKPFHV